ncbi:MAG: ImmA/IrrE family metallo-endopeptidase [bacterium]
MQNISSSIDLETNNLYESQQSTLYGIPIIYADAYFFNRKKLISQAKILVDTIFSTFGKTLQFPLNTEPIEKFLSGYEIKFTPFNNKLKENPNYEGFYYLKEDGKTLQIFYNTHCSIGRQRFTKMHELFHFCQSRDEFFLDIIDDLIENDTLPIDLIVQLVEKSSDKATTFYLMPENIFIKKYYELDKSVKKLSNYFQTSQQSVIYRLKECKLI